MTLAALQLMAPGAAPGPAAAPASAGAPAHSPVSWTVRAVSNQYGSGRSGFGYTLNAGDGLNDGLEITNNGTDPITLDVYGADGFTTAAGGFDTRPGDEQPKDLGAWVRPAVSSVTIAAGRRAQVPFSIAVPTNATPGDHVGGIVTELDRHRVGLGIKVRVTGKVAPQLKIEKLSVDFAGSNPFGTGTATVAYTVHNVGNTVLSGLPRATVAGAFGLGSRTIDGPRLPQLLPGERWSAVVRVDGAQGMVWGSATLTVTPFVTDAAGSTSTLPPVSASDHAFVSVWSYVVLLLLAAALVAIAALAVRLARRVRRPSGPAPDRDAAHEAQVTLSNGADPDSGAFTISGNCK